MAGDWFSGGSKDWFSSGSSSSEFRKSKSAQAKRMFELDDEQKMQSLLVQEEQKKKDEASQRSGFSKAFDQINPLDSGRTWASAGDATGAAKSTAQQAKEIGSAWFTGVEKVGDSVEALTGVAARRTEHWTKQLNEGKITREQYQKLLEGQSKDTEWAGTEDKGTGDRLKKSAGVALEATSEIVPFMKAGKATQLTTKAGAAFGAATGLAHGTGTELTNPEGFNPVNVGLQTGFGAGAGALGGWMAQRAAANKAAKIAAEETSLINSQMDDAAAKAAKALDDEPITDPARLLPDGSQSKAARLSEIDNELDQIRTDPNYAPPKSKEMGTYSKVESDPNAQLTGGKTKADGDLDMRYGASKKAGVTAVDKAPKLNNKASRARELMRERDQITKEIEAIKDPVQKTAEIINQVDGDLARARKAGNVSEIKRLEKEQAFMEGEAARIDKQLEIENAVGTGETKTSRVGQRTEDVTLRNQLGEAFGDLPTYQTTNLADEASVVVDHMNADMDGAIRVGMGLESPPPGASPESYYVGLINRAQKTGDYLLAKKLALESTISEGASRMGQRISALQNLDPENPVVAIKSILKARKDALPKAPATISDEEAKQISKLGKDLIDAKDAALAGGDKKAYGDASVAYHKYVADLVASAKPELAAALKSPKFYGKTALKVTGLTKSMITTLDNSVIGRQGWKTMFSNNKVWRKNSLQSFMDIARTLKGTEVMDHVHSDVVSRDNAMNGLYKQMGLKVFGASKEFLEEAFPVSFGRVTKNGAGKYVLRPFKASETAFSAWQQRTRADLADFYLDLAVKQGVDITDPKELQSIGKLVNSLTSRGDLGKNGERVADTLNKVFFSPRLLKSNIDVLGGHIVTGAGGSNFVRKQAAKNLIKISVGSAMALKVASEVFGGDIEADPRSSNFGKLKIGSTRFDLTGGMAGPLTLGARFLTDSTKSSQTGEVKKLNTGEYGSQTTMDTVMDFAENKLSPAAGAFVDWKKGENFEGDKPTVMSTVKSLTIPLIIQQYDELKSDPNAANATAAIIAEGLGIGTNTYSLKSNWNANNGKAVEGFESAVSKKSFSEANTKFNNEFNDWYKQASADDRFWKLPLDERDKLVTKKKNNLTDEIMASYGYKYKQPSRKKDDNDALADSLLKMYQ